VTAMVQDRCGLEASEGREMDYPVPTDDEVQVRVQTAGLDWAVVACHDRAAVHDPAGLAKSWAAQRRSGRARPSRS
jgi:hypothetical protein